MHICKTYWFIWLLFFSDAREELFSRFPFEHYNVLCFHSWTRCPTRTRATSRWKPHSPNPSGETSTRKQSSGKTSSRTPWCRGLARSFSQSMRLLFCTGDRKGNRRILNWRIKNPAHHPKRRKEAVFEFPSKQKSIGVKMKMKKRKNYDAQWLERPDSNLKTLGLIPCLPVAWPQHCGAAESKHEMILCITCVSCVPCVYFLLFADA